MRFFPTWWSTPQVVTFDAQGVSGHVNHRAVHAGVREAQERLAPCKGPHGWSPAAITMDGRPCSVVWAAATDHATQSGLAARGPVFLQLHSRPLPFKYLGVLDVVATGLGLGLGGPSAVAAVATATATVKGWLAMHAAMAAHASQLVYYRRLFMVFASTAYVNVLAPVQ